MTRKQIFLAIVLLLLLSAILLNSTTLAADGPEITRYATSAGGASEGGEYSLQGTIGQAETGTVTGGEYDLSGGFWGGIVVQIQELFLPLITLDL